MNILQSLDVWLNGFPEPPGRLESADLGLAFHYRPTYLERGPHALFLSLPLSPEPFGDADARAFFGNLLPEASRACLNSIFPCVNATPFKYGAVDGWSAERS